MDASFWSLNVGQLITLATYLVGGIAFVMALKADVRAVNVDLTNLKQVVDNLEKDLNKLSEILVMVARQDERLNGIDRRIEEIRRGEGLIFKAD